MVGRAGGVAARRGPEEHGRRSLDMRQLRDLRQLRQVDHRVFEGAGFPIPLVLVGLYLHEEKARALQEQPKSAGP